MKRKQSGTPAPWFPVAVGGAYRVIAQDDNGTAFVVAHVGDPASEVDAANRVRREADAELIAAAPKLARLLYWVGKYIPDEVARCHGNQCREPWCADCQGEEDAAYALADAREAQRQARLLLEQLQV